MSHQGGDNHFISARERDLGPLLVEGRADLELDGEKGEMLEAFLETAWLTGTRSGHAKLLNHAIRERGEQLGGDWETPVEPVQMQDIEAEFKAMMEASAEALDLSVGHTVVLWDLLCRAWTSGVHTYESAVMTSTIERKSDITGEAQRWLEGDKRD